MLLDVLPEPMFILDLQGRLIDMNPAARRLFGWPASGLPELGTQALLDEPAERLAALLRQGLRAGGPSPVRLVLRLPEGRSEPCRCQLFRVQPGNGRPLSVLVRILPGEAATSRFIALNERIEALSREVARRREAEDALRAQSEWLRVVLRSIGDAVIATDAQGRVVLMNPVAERLCGWTLGEAMGQPVEAVFSIIHAGSRLPASCPVRRALRERRIVGLDPDTALVTRAGDEHPIDDAAGPILDDQGVLVGIVLIFREISARLLAERERRVLEQQLRESQRMESVGALAGGIAHDFNNVLVSILGNTMLARGEIPPAHPAASRLEQIDRAGRRARELVRQIMAFSRRQPRRMQRECLQDLIEECTTMLRSTLPSSVLFEVSLPPEPMHVMADATQIEQVLMNLCTNAWHSLRGSSGRIVVSLVRHEGPAPEGLVPGFCPMADGPHGHISVVDDGCGIEPQHMPRLFEPFFTTKAAGKGTGLGLAVAHGIVAEHGGTMAVRSTPGAGTCFDLLLPLSAGEPAERVQAAEAPVRARGAALGARVMYVDDDDVLSLTVQALLQRAGFDVVVCRDGAAAIERLAAAPFAVDVLVTDYNMPGLSGLDVAAEVLRLRPDLPVVVTSGFITEDLQQSAQRIAGVRLLNKEDSHDRLVPLIEDLLPAA